MKSIYFKYIEGEAASLGVPEKVVFEKGTWRDGGCSFKFQTSQSAIGIKENFFMYLFAEDINNISFKMWEKYIETEPKRAKEDFEHLKSFIEEKTKEIK